MNSLSEESCQIGSVQFCRNCQLNSATLISLQDARSRSSDSPRQGRVRPCPEDAQGRPADHVALKIVCIVNCGVRQKETLSGFARFESEHLLLAPSDREMCIPGAVVPAQTSALAAID